MTIIARAKHPRAPRPRCSPKPGRSPRPGHHPITNRSPSNRSPSVGRNAATHCGFGARWKPATRRSAWMARVAPFARGPACRRRTAVAAVIAASLPAGAPAQQVTQRLPEQAAEQTQQQAAQPNVLEEIVVTAGFRDSRLMTSPGSTTVIDETAIADRAAQHLESVLHSAANVNYASGASRARFLQVRGVGDLEQFVDPKHFPSVGIRVDDIDLGSAANAAMLFDQEQVEFLRGPQGTAFGTSALAGLVNIRGRRPGDSFEGHARVGVGDYGGRHAGGAIGGPLGGRLGDTVAARLAVLRNRSDGHVDNVHLQREDTNGHDETAIRAMLQFDPDDASAYGLTALYFDARNGYDAFSLDNTRETLSDQPGHDNQETLAVAARGEWRLGGAMTLEAVATRLDSDLEYGYDEDWTFQGICDGSLCHPVFDFYSNTDRYLRDRGETSFDIRLLGGSDATGGARRFVLGVYAQDRDEDLHRRHYGDFFSYYETRRRAVYGQLETAFNERLGLTVGLRLERFDDRYRDTANFQSATDDSLGSGELTLSWQPRGGPFLYATLARGSKAGAVNTEASSSLALMQPRFQAFIRPRLTVDTETILSRELGIKGAWLEDRLALRAAVFDMDRGDAQLESWMWDGVSFLWIGFLDNADGSNRGAEVEMAYRLPAGAQLSASLGWLDTRIDAIETFDLDAGEFVQRNRIEQAKSPGWQYHLGLSLPLADALTARVELEGRDASRFGYYHLADIGSYGLVNASVRYRAGRTEWQLWGRNLTDETYAVHGLYFGNDPRKGWINETYYQYGEPRVLGVTVRYSF